MVDPVELYSIHFIKKPKRVELQPNTYGYLEAMGALGNAQRTGKIHA